MNFYQFWHVALAWFKNSHFIHTTLWQNIALFTHVTVGKISKFK